jgi:hypothetical protein
VRRLEEEQELDKVRRQRVEDIIQKRQEEEEMLRKQPVTLEQQEEQKLVEVEPNNILPSDLSSIYALVPYSVRRSKVGLEVGLTYSQFTPSNYRSSFAAASLTNYDDLYASANTPLLELYFNTKYNFPLGSIGGEFAYGMYNNESDDDSFGELTLELQVIRLGAKFILDNLFYEPYIAPYASGGFYTVLFTESAASNSFNGNTQPAPYFSVGALFQLNWVDRSSAVESYAEAGIENTFLFAELRTMMESSAVEDPDFSTDPTINVGVSLEF